VVGKHGDVLAAGDGVRLRSGWHRAKAGRDALTLTVLGLLAGGFIACGAIFMTVVLTGASELPWGGVGRLLAGLAFSLGLILVIVGEAEVFTGDSLMIVACASARITVKALLRAWSLVYRQCDRRDGYSRTGRFSLGNMSSMAA
jgi:formate/nitrite transporter FocA (FNT family)